MKDVGFPTRTTSLRALPRGSEGDLPTLSHRLSQLSCDKSADSMLTASVESMDYSTTSGAGEEGRVASKTKVSKTAKSVTDRLYQAPAPKFKYEPKSRSPKPASPARIDREKMPGRASPARIDREKTPGKASPARGEREKTPRRGDKRGHSKDDSDNTSDRYRRKGEGVDTRGVSPRSSPARTISPAAKVTKTLSSATKPKLATSKEVGRDAKSKQTGKDFVDSLKPSLKVSIGKKPSQRIGSSRSPDRNLLSPDSPSAPKGRNRRLSPTPGLSPEQGTNGSGRVFVPRLRHVTSATSLVNVPEAIAEEVEPMESSMIHSTPNIPQTVVKRRKKKQNPEDEFRRHSEPMGEELADAFEKYTNDIEESMERERSGKRFVDNLSSEVSFSIKEGECALNDNKVDIPLDMDTGDMRQVKSDSDLQRKVQIIVNNCEVNDKVSAVNSVTCQGREGETATQAMECALEVAGARTAAQGVECSIEGSVNMENDENLMVCSTSSAVSDTLSVESNTSDASTVIEVDNVFHDSSENVQTLDVDNINFDVTEGANFVKAGSKRESVMDNDDVPSKAPKTEIKCVNQITKVKEGLVVESDVLVCEEISSRRKKKDGSDKSRKAKAKAEYVEVEGYSSDSLDEVDNSFDSLDKSKSPRDSLGEGDNLSDSLDDSDTDMQKSGTLTSQTSVTSLGESYSSNLTSSADCRRDEAELPSADLDEGSSVDLPKVASLVPPKIDNNVENNELLSKNVNETDSCPVQSLESDKSDKNSEKSSNKIDNNSEKSDIDNVHKPKTDKCKQSDTKKPSTKPKKPRPATRTLGVSTSPDLMPPELLDLHDDDGASQASHDSLQEVKEQLMELEEALEKESQEQNR